MEPVRAFWWKGRANFGDRLTPLLLERFAHLPAVWAEPANAELSMVGSILEAFPRAWGGIIAGSGKMFESTELHFHRAEILALRGPLTAKGVHGVYALGDMALLANELVTVNKVHQLGIVPHWSDTELEHRPEFKSLDPHIIRPSRDPLEVVREIGRCRKIVSSSLHGVIVADAFGIPRRMEMAPALAAGREGGDFKFRDHCAALTMECVFGRTDEAPRYRVQDLQHVLFDVLEMVGERLAR